MILILLKFICFAVFFISLYYCALKSDGFADDFYIFKLVLDVKKGRVARVFGGENELLFLRIIVNSFEGCLVIDNNRCDIVFIRSQSSVDNGEIAAVIINDEATLKRVYYYPDEEKLVLSPENPRYAPLLYVKDELENIKIIGKAVAFQSSVV